MAKFIAEQLEVQQQKIPYFEDAQSEKIPGRGTEKSVGSLQTEIADLLNRMGATLIQFKPGVFDENPKRYGFQITFWLSGCAGRIDCAALPMRNEAPKRKDRALAQALYLLRDELQAQVYSMMHKPDSIPLVPYLVGPGGKTVTEWLVEEQQIPLLPQGGNGK